MKGSCYISIALQNVLIPMFRDDLPPVTVVNPN